ncbi:MAG: hypothetical protein DI535_15530 [Citrobacter freundii]|nr:MAG: hypothetical protein DI535_15530 [Citrobacter freundii]
MKLLLGTVALGIAMLSFAGTGTDNQKVSSEKVVSAYQDTLPKKDTSKKDKKEKRDTLNYRY